MPIITEYESDPEDVSLGSAILTTCLRDALLEDLGRTAKCFRGVWVSIMSACMCERNVRSLLYVIGGVRNVVKNETKVQL